MTRPIPTALHDQPLVIADVEGNGQQPPDIVEIALLPVDGPVSGQHLKTWLVRPVRRISPIVQRIHGISNDDVEHSPPWSAVQDEIHHTLTGRTLIAHNASVEHKVIGAHLPQWQPPMVLDTMRLAKHVWPDLASYGLENLVAHAEIDTSDIPELRAHRAGYDTWCAWQLFCTLLDDAHLDWTGLVKVAALRGFEPPGEPEGGLW